MTTSGGLYCWGTNADGNLNNGSATNATTKVPVKVLDVAGQGSTWYAAGLVAIDGTTCAQSSSTDNYYCWGANDLSGRFGDGTSGVGATNHPNDPTLIPFP